VTELGFAMLGYGFMGRAHSLALRALAALEQRPAAVPRLVSICGRDPDALERAGAQYGWDEAVTDWRDQVADPRVAVFDNAGPNALHLEPTLAAIENGKHVFCEKPLGRTAAEAHRLWVAADRAGAVHMCGFNLRFLPAVRLARELLESGQLGEPTHVRARFLASSALRADQRRTWRFRRSSAGSGAVADLGSHLVDLARYLTGEIAAVSAATRTFVGERDGAPVDVDDAFAAVIELEGGGIGTLEASRAAGRRSGACSVEVDATRGSISFDAGRLNELEVVTRRKETRRIEVTDPGHPFMELWWPAPGHAIGWGDSFTHELRHLTAAVAGATTVRPLGADFEDGYRCAEVCDAILRAAETGAREAVAYRPAPEEAPATLAGGRR
jgi:predicted dehydrogenase